MKTPLGLISMTNAMLSLLPTQCQLLPSRISELDGVGAVKAQGPMVRCWESPQLPSNAGLFRNRSGWKNDTLGVKIFLEHRVL